MFNLKTTISVGSQKFSLEVKNNFFQRLRGLLGKNQLADNEGIVLVNCKQVHTFGMRFSIDIIVLDKDFKIINFISNLRANKVSPYFRKGYYIIELTTKFNHKDLFKKGQILKILIN